MKACSGLPERVRSNEGLGIGGGCNCAEGSDGEGPFFSCACSAKTERIFLPKAQDPLTDYVVLGRRHFCFEEPTNYSVPASARFVLGEAVAALLRGVQSSDFETRVVQTAALVRGHGAF